MACVLGRKSSEAVIIYNMETGVEIARVFIARTGKELVKLGFDARPEIGFAREELWIQDQAMRTS